MTDDRLTLLARDSADLPVMSAVLQDAIVRAGDVGWDRRGRRLALLVSRYRWESEAPSRVRSALRIETAFRVERKHWPRDPESILALLSVTAEGDRITLAFADGISLRAEIECLDALLEDLAAPWPVRYRPDHGG